MSNILYHKNMNPPPHKVSFATVMQNVSHEMTGSIGASLQQNMSSELCILSHPGVIATAETSVISCIGCHPTKNHLDGGKY